MTFRKIKNQLIFAVGLLFYASASFAFINNSSEKASDENLKKTSLSLESSDLLKELSRVSFSGAEMSFKNIVEDYPELTETYDVHLANLKKFEKRAGDLLALVEQNNSLAVEEAKVFLDEHRAALLQNPVLKGKEILAVRQIVENARKAMAGNIGRNGNNWTTNATIKRTGWNNEICKLSDLSGDVKLSTVFKTKNGVPVKDIDLHWDGEKMLFSSVGVNDRWHVYEMDYASGEIEQLTPSELTDVDYFDACYLPDGNIIIASTASYVGVPCIGGGQPASDLYLLDREKNKIRQLNFGQDCDWNPVILNNGKVCYLRWEYTDNSHYFTRILMNMNPDGTAKKEYYGSGSYFPNSLFDSRPIPNHPSQFVGVISGHHGIARSGRLLIFDPTKGRKEADGVVQEIPGYGKEVEPIIVDQLVNGVWPQFLTPFPLSEDYFLVSAKMSPKELWGIYLVDRFDNMTLVYNKEGEAFTEPFVTEKREIPPVIPSRVNENSTTSTVYISDIYEGQGLKGIPRGTVKNMRIYAYQYGYNKVGGHDLIGLEAGWDVKRILGTVPVEEDGSAMFTIPANTPISMQPLDEHGSALQLMRSWMTAMPGEVVSCVGCHESQNTVPQSKFTTASRKRPENIKPWYGPTRPVTYNNELKPVIDKNCVACHNGMDSGRPDFSSNEDSKYHGFSKSYMALHPYIRRPGCESDFYTLEPMDFYSNTSELVQMLRKGHHGVELNNEEWDRLITWIDMNVPYRGSYEPRPYGGFDQVVRRDELLNHFGNVSLSGERELAIADSLRVANGAITPVLPNLIKKGIATDVTVNGWPIKKKAAAKLQQKFAVNGEISKTVKLENGISLEFVRIPAGHFVIGDNNGQPDQKESIVEIKDAYWMLKTEITNEMFRSIFADHNSRHIDQQWKDHIFPGYKANKDEQPVIRVTWNQANEFCAELSKQTGLNISLPSEAQWEWAARAGSEREMYFGEASKNFSKYENLADYTLRDLAVIGVDPKPMGKKNNRFEFYNFVPKVEKYNDGVLVPEGTAGYKPNAWGLYDMLGNVAEWTSSNYSYEGYKGEPAGELKVAKGGSWRDRPKFATTASRDGYLPYQKVFNVGFRIVINESSEVASK
ncbi:MAG: SUMF1/EgtB/PvdO family nonheme iron enzyme [Bacteroidetes bacterium]|nr:SUMF1/EgtB/PvdO family nonheme iron enzyme [Bacteroidota bacterium]